jgi:hypothetical protein
MDWLVAPEKNSGGGIQPERPKPVQRVVLQGVTPAILGIS